MWVQPYATTQSIQTVGATKFSVVFFSVAMVESGQERYLLRRLLICTKGLYYIHCCTSCNMTEFSTQQKRILELALKCTIMEIWVMMAVMTQISLP